MTYISYIYIIYIYIHTHTYTQIYRYISYIFQEIPGLAKVNTNLRNKDDQKNHFKIALIGRGSAEQIPKKRQNCDWILGQLECLSAFLLQFH